MLRFCELTPFVYSDITGVLCYGSGHFLQCIEGEKAHVLALLKVRWATCVVILPHRIKPF
ncbi:BLUF domain-containing protein [Psychrobacter namhaensis]|uniref:BLUF domain-containing protein n=1 Tax=Psychrobacter namhaensis TaxID=292734 RepID=UPI001D018BC3|nr:BLUF domain-containing protein [Psychrobacter sp.]